MKKKMKTNNNLKKKCKNNKCVGKTAKQEGKKTKIDKTTTFL